MSKKSVWILISICALLIVSALIFGAGKEFAGGDDQMQEVVSQVHEGYEPWSAPIWEPPSGEVESFLFAFQAAVGAGFVGYYIGKKQGQFKGNEKNKKENFKADLKTQA